MGLDISHNAWHGAYSAFMGWREKIAEVAGFPPLCLMEGFWQGAEHYSSPFFNFKKLYPTGDELGATSFKRFVEQLPIKWDSLKPSPLIDLLYHSDCEGDLSYSKANKIADELEKLLPLLPNEDAGGHIGNWRDKTQKFIDGCRLAYKKKEKLLFR